MAVETGDRAGAEPARAAAPSLPPDRAADAGPHATRSSRRSAALDGGAASHGLQGDHAADPVPGRERRRRAATRRSRTCAARPSEAIAEGYNIIILSDRGHDAENAPIPALLAVAGGPPPPDPRGHAHAASASCSRRASRARCTTSRCSSATARRRSTRTSPSRRIDDMVQLGHASRASTRTPRRTTSRPSNKGDRQGRSRRWASPPSRATTAPRCSRRSASTRTSSTSTSPGPPTRVGGIGIDVIAEGGAAAPRARLPAEAADRPHEPRRRRPVPVARDGEHHLFNPETIHKLQYACRTGDYKAFKEYTALVDDQAKQLCHPARPDGVQAGPRRCRSRRSSRSSRSCKRFKTGAMSYGSISQGGARGAGHRDEPHRRQVEHRRGRRGPGALHARRRTATRRTRAIKQVASGRFGVTSEYLVNASELQIKMAQGAKPGEGGQLPGSQGLPVDREDPPLDAGRRAHLAAAAPRHLLDRGPRAADPRPEEREPPRARISVKLVAEVGVGTIAAGVAKAHADVVLICGHDGGTGASPLTSIKHAGMPWELGLAETHQMLVLNDLRSRIARRDGRPAQDRPRRRHRRAARRRGVRLRHRAARRARLHHDARLPPQHLPGRRRDAGPGAPREVRRRARSTSSTSCASSRRRCARSWPSSASAPSTRWSAASDRLEMRRAVDHWKARGLDFSPDPPPADGADARTAATCQIPQDHGLETDARRRRRCSSSASRRSRSASRSRRRCRSGTSTASSARCSAARSRAATAPDGLPGRHHPAPLQGLGRPELRRVRPAGA